MRAQKSRRSVHNLIGGTTFRSEDASSNANKGVWEG